MDDFDRIGEGSHARGGVNGHSKEACNQQKKFHHCGETPLHAVAFPWEPTHKPVTALAMSNRAPWWNDKSLLSAVVVGIAMRLIPLLLWLDWVCVRDECTYSKISRRIVDGEGMVGSAGWLWAPGYPMIVAVHRWLTGVSGSTKVTQIVAAAVCTVLLYRLVQRVYCDWDDVHRQRTARIAAWMYALSPHMIFFSISLWSEVLYGTLLLARCPSPSQV